MQFMVYFTNYKHASVIGLHAARRLGLHVDTFYIGLVTNKTYFLLNNKAIQVQLPQRLQNNATRTVT